MAAVVVEDVHHGVNLVAEEGVAVVLEIKEFNCRRVTPPTMKNVMDGISESFKANWTTRIVLIQQVLLNETEEQVVEVVAEDVDRGRRIVIGNNVDRDPVVGLPVRAVSVTAENLTHGIVTRVGIGAQKPNGDLGGVVPHNVVDHARRNAAEIVATRVRRLAAIRLFPKPK